MPTKPIPKVSDYLAKNRTTILVWLAIVLIVAALVGYNRASKAALQAKLTSSDKSARMAEIRKLAEDRSLADALVDTEDPNSPADSPANVASNQLREASAASLNELIAARQIPTDVAVDNLLMLRKDADGAVKSDATDGLVLIGKESEANIRMLVGKLSDGDPDVRSAASDALGAIGGPQIAQLVAPLLSSQVASADAQAALTKIGPAAVPFLTPLLSTSKLDLSSQVIGMLATIGDVSAIPALVAQVNAQPPIPTLRRLSIIALANLVLKSIPTKAQTSTGSTPEPAPSPQTVALADSTVPIFRQTLDSVSEDSLARSRSALALGRLGGADAVASLIDALGDFDIDVARSATTGVEQIGPAAVPSLSAAARSPSESVRIAAASALGSIEGTEALAAIQPSLHDPSADVRVAAARALGTSADPAAVALLIPLLNDPRGQVAGAASVALERIGAPAVSSLVDALGSSNPVAEFYASQSLLHIGSGAVPDMLQLLSSQQSESKKIWAVVTLGEIRDKRAAPGLTALASSGSVRERWAATQAIEELS